MREFWIYTGLRLLMFAAAVAIVGGVWLAVTDSANLMWVLIISLAVSGLASYFLLDPWRTALARRVDERARKATEKFEEMKAKEDAD